MAHGKDKKRPLRITQGDRDGLLVAPPGPVGVYRKRARVLARRMSVPFTVTTEHGEMSGEPGDWLVCNHPDDDPGTDMWPVSAERMATTYTAIVQTNETG